jgi:chromosome segregation ATPase
LADEFLSVERFEDFKQEMSRGFSDIKESQKLLSETLSGRLSELTTEIKGYNSSLLLQSQISYNHEKEIDVLKKNAEKLEDKVLDQSIKINTLETTQNTNHRNLGWIITFVGIFLTVLQIILRFFPGKSGG